MKLVKRSRQRNYRRNNDIIYNGNDSKFLNEKSVYYYINNEGNFVLDNGWLLFNYNLNDTDDTINGYKYITMDSDGAFLIGYYPNEVKDDLFFIDESGILVWQQ